MSLPNQQSPYLRYFKSQLLNLKRPSFWGTAIFLCLVGVIIRQYWENPTNIFALDTQQDKPIVTQQPANAGLTDDERADFADIDNLPVFLNDYQQGILSIATNNSAEKNQTQKNENFLQEVIKKQNASNEAKSKANLEIGKKTDINNIKNPFVLQAENLLQPEISSGNSQFLGYKPLNSSVKSSTTTVSSSPFGGILSNQNRQSQNSELASTLEPALNQSNNQSFSSFTRNNTSSYINPYPSTNQTLPSFTNTNTISVSPFSSSYNGRTTVTPNQNLPTNTGMGYVDPSLTKPLQNSSGGVNNNQTFPNQVTPITGVAPVTNTLPNNSYSNNNNYLPNQSQSGVNSTNSTGYSNYGSTGLPQSNYGNYSNYGVQQPNQLPQSNYNNSGWQQPSQSPPNPTYPGTYQR